MIANATTMSIFYNKSHLDISLHLTDTSMSEAQQKEVTVKVVTVPTWEMTCGACILKTSTPSIWLGFICSPNRFYILAINVVSSLLCCQTVWRGHQLRCGTFENRVCVWSVSAAHPLCAHWDLGPNWQCLAGFVRLSVFGTMGLHGVIYSSQDLLFFLSKSFSSEIELFNVILSTGSCFL